MENMTKTIVKTLIIVTILAVTAYGVVKLYNYVVADVTKRVKTGVKEGVSEGIGEGVGEVVNPVNLTKKLIGVK